MEGQRERTMILDEFMKNTGAGRLEATHILSRNGWKLSDSYREHQQLVATAGQRNHGFFTGASGGGFIGNSSQFKAIDVGVGAAVHLDKKNAGSSQQPVQQSDKQLETCVMASHKQTPLPAALSVQLPSAAGSSIRGGRIIPIQVEGQRNPPQHRGSYQPILLGNSATTNPFTDSHLPPASYQLPMTGQTQPRVVMNESEQTSQPHIVSPTMEKDVSAENDDVFDDKMTSHPPSLNTYPRLKRGFSNIVDNQGIVSEARQSVKVDIQRDSHTNMYVQTFVLPDLTSHSEDFRAFLEKELIETSTLVSLEQAGRLNWWAELRLCQRLLPMATSGDGNCLLHAASLAMWGIHDRQLILRKELHETLTKAPYKDALYRRWRYQQTMNNKQSGLVFSESEWEEEWTNILRLASPLPRGAAYPGKPGACYNGLATQKYEEPVVYESLEEFHVFVLAHVLQRPIIVVADTILKDSSGDALAPIPFPGIYLPLETQPCFKSPLLLTYDAAHFSALVPMEQNPVVSLQLPAAIPLQEPDLSLLPLRFHMDPGVGVDWSHGFDLEVRQEDPFKLLHKFLELERIPVVDVNGDSDRGSCGSQDSDETGTLVKDKKKKDARMAQQVQTVAKQFGSIGKTMGKKLKQLGKVGKAEKPRRPSVGNEITQATRVHSNYGIARNGQETVLVAKLTEKRSKQQQELIHNYLLDARKRFESDRELKRRSDVELRSKVAPYPAISSDTICSTPGCQMFGTAQTNYYCSQCFATQQRLSSVANKAGGSFVYNTFPRRDHNQPAAFSHLTCDDIFKYGKSTFYTASNENLDKVAAVPVSSGLSAASYNNNINDSRVRSPSPDYDNCSDFGSGRGDRLPPSSPKPIIRQYPNDRQHCRNSGCDFFGSFESDGLCSKCYQQKYKDCMSKVIQGVTKL